MDKLDSAITALRIEIDKDERALGEKRLRLAALLEAAELRPAASVPSKMRAADPDAMEAARKRAHRTGRAPGSISSEWRRYFGEIVSRGNQPMPRSDYVSATSQRFNLAPASVRQRLRSHLDAGHLSEDERGVFVSEAAIERFRLSRIVIPGGDESDQRASDGVKNATAPH